MKTIIFKTIVLKADEWKNNVLKTEKDKNP